MQKDIRKYDMKEVEFQQDGENRRFLILEVSKYFFGAKCYSWAIFHATQKNSQCNIP